MNLKIQEKFDQMYSNGDDPKDIARIIYERFFIKTLKQLAIDLVNLNEKVEIVHSFTAKACVMDKDLISRKELKELLRKAVEYHGMDDIHATMYIAFYESTARYCRLCDEEEPEAPFEPYVIKNSMLRFKDWVKEQYRFFGN